jgi:integrase
MDFTNEAVASLTAPAGKSDYIAFDPELPGLGIRIRGGKRTWVVQFRASGRQRRQTIGDVRKYDVDVARKIAKKILASAELGGDPLNARKQARKDARNTLGVIIAEYLAIRDPKAGLFVTRRHREPLRPSTYVADQRYLMKYWKPLHCDPISSITKADIAQQLNRFKREYGLTAAERARETLNGLFAWAIGEGRAEVNPVVSTNHPLDGAKPRDRVLSDTELKAVWDACLDDDFGAIVRLMILTACRRDEIGGLKWPEIDFTTSTLRLPALRTKSHRELLLPLPATATNILKSRLRRDGRDYVFGTRGGAFSRWSWEKLALDKRVAEGGRQIASWCLHDLRRTARTGMGKIGVKPHVAELVLNHAGHKSGIGGTYDLHDYQVEIKSALAMWADHVRAIIEGGESRIVPLQSAS